MSTTETPLDDQSAGLGVRHLVELLLVPALVDQSAKHTLLVLEKVGRRTELSLSRRSVTEHEERGIYVLTMRPASSTN